MELLLSIAAVICVLVGVAGCVVPMLPGPPIAFLGMLLAQWSGRADFSTRFFLIWGAVTIAVTVIDYFLPIWMTKRFGGSKQATRGATVGIVVGMFFMPAGIILGPFFGALIGELLRNREDSVKAFKVAFGSFAAFIFGTGMKLVASVLMAWYTVKGIFC